MAQKKKQARSVKWRGRWYLFYTDHLTGQQKRVTCESKGATNAELRRELVRQVQSVELVQRAEVELLGGVISGDVKFLDEINEYIQQSEERVGVRKDNAEAREGLSDNSFRLVRHTMNHLLKWLKDNGHADLRTKDVTEGLVRAYINHVVTQPAGLAESSKKRNAVKKKKKKRSAGTISYYKRYVRACLNWINGRRPRRFADFTPLLKPLKPSGGDSKSPVSFGPDELRKFYEKAIEWEDPKRLVEAKPIEGSRKKRIHLQTVASVCNTPVSRLFLLLAMTGCRLGEALAMKWDQVDLNYGHIRIYSMKTGRTRYLPLTGDKAGEVGPRMVELLKCWHTHAESDYVLPHGKLDAPIFPRRTWTSIAEAASLAISPQKLRQNFTSYAISLGVPASVAAKWLGHGVAVADKHYVAQVLNRRKGNNVEEATGLVDILDELIGEVHNSGSERAGAIDTVEQTRIETSLAKLASSLALFKNSVPFFTEEDSTFRPDDEMFTVAQQVAHVAIMVDWYMEPLISGEGFDTDLDGLAQRARGVVSLNTAMHMVEKAYSSVDRFISNQDEAYLMTPLPNGPVMGGAPRIAVVDGIVSHTTYHCGSLAVYARLANKIPAIPYEMVNDDGPKRARLSE